MCRWWGRGVTGDGVRGEGGVRVAGLASTRLSEELSEEDSKCFQNIIIHLSEI